MASVAAGIATTGATVFMSSFAMFAAGRAFEQVRNSIGYPHLNVKIGATHGGITVGEDGATHQCNEDFATMRVIPGMTVICPADGTEAKAAVEAAILHKGPVYMRFGRFAVPYLFDTDTYKFEIGKGIVLAEGKDVTIAANGFMTHVALEARKILADKGIDAEVINVHTVKPLDTELLAASAGKTGCVVTAEEHNIVGGFGSAVCEALAGVCPVPVKRVGIEDRFGKSGKVPALLEEYGLTPQNVAAKALEAVAMKRK